MIAKKVKKDTVDKKISSIHGGHVVVFKCTYDTIGFSIRY